MTHHDKRQRDSRNNGKQHNPYMYLQEDIIMKTCNNKLLGLVLTGGLSLFATQAAYAAAGDPISNTATLNYSVSGSSQTGIESSEAGNTTPGVGAGTATTFVEDRVINFTVTREGGAVSVVPNSSQQAIPFLVDNTGNGTHGFLLAGVHNTGALDPHGTGASDTFTPTTIETYVDTDGDGVLDPGEIAAGNSFIASFAPGVGTATGGSSTGSEIRVFVVADIPVNNTALNPLVNNEVAVMTLVAQAAIDGTTGIAADAIVADDNGNTSPGGTFTNGGAVVAAGTAATNADTSAMETVFNDTATTDAVTGATIDATGANDADQNAQQSAYSGYLIDSAELTVAKTSAVIWDFINLASSPKAIPGGGAGSGTIIRYTITISNAAGAATATLDNIQDVVPLALDTQFGDGTNANAAVSGVNNVRITDGASTTVFCQADNADGNGDGCQYDGTAGVDPLVVDLTSVAGITNSLAATQSLTIEFDVELP